MVKKSKPKKTTNKPKRVLVWVDGGIADAAMDRGVEWELIDWDNIRNGEHWEKEDIDRLEKWGKGLVSAECIKTLRQYAAK